MGVVRDKVKTRALDPCACHKVKSRNSTFPSILWADGLIFSVLSPCAPVSPLQIPGHCGNDKTREARPKRHLKRPWLHWCPVWLQERLQAEFLFPQGGTIQCKGIYMLKAFPWSPGGLPLRMMTLVLGSEDVLPLPACPYPVVLTI